MAKSRQPAWGSYNFRAKEQNFGIGTASDLEIAHSHLAPKTTLC